MPRPRGFTALSTKLSSACVLRGELGFHPRVGKQTVGPLHLGCLIFSFRLSLNQFSFALILTIFLILNPTLTLTSNSNTSSDSYWNPILTPDSNSSSTVTVSVTFALTLTHILGLTNPNSYSDSHANLIPQSNHCTYSDPLVYLAPA